MALFMPESNWETPTVFPDLKQAKMIGLDTETRDPDLTTMGPSCKRGGGYIIGVSVATDDGFKAYYPVRHDGGGNLDAPNVFAWLKDVLSSDVPKVGANIIYDLEWLRTEGIEVRGPKYDIQVAEPLLDESRRTYKLDALAESYLGVHKNEDLLNQAAEAMGIPKSKVKENLWRMPAKYVGPYGEDDALLALQVFNLQLPRIAEEGLGEVFELETRVTEVLLAMRDKGIPIDLDRAIQIRDKLHKEQRQIEHQLCQVAGRELDVWSGTDISEACNRLGLYYPKTEKGNPSFEAEFLEESSSEEFFRLLLLARQLDRGGSVFIQKKIIEMQVGGRIYPTFRQVRSDDGGTRSGRFASANPNMQQVPARNPYLAPLIRSIFVPEHGCQWGVFDYSQQEPRVTVHYANRRGFTGANRALEQYISNPATDYHQLVADMAGINRKQAKTLNLGLAYGMGKKKMSGQLGLSIEDTTELYDKYHGNVPFIKLLGDECMRVANDRGYIKTILGRRRRFDLFGPRKWTEGVVPLPKAQALEKFGAPVVRYFVHKAMNSLIQGSSADMIKKAMVDLYDEGIISHITIHDELDNSIESMKQARIIRDTMLCCVKIDVPLKVDVELGPSWGEAKEVSIDEV